MGRDNHPKERQRRALERKRGIRAGYDRVLIVCEGSKTEPQYLNEIRSARRLQTANVQVQPSQLGTAPIQVVHYARQLFEKGDRHKRISARAFEKVFAVFDRDDHHTYFEALTFAAALDGSLRNDANKSVEFRAIASVPSFELWPLLHYEDIAHPLNRDEVFGRLKQHIPGYEKAMHGLYEITKSRLPTADQRARRLSEVSHAHDGSEPYTDIHVIVAELMNLGR